MDAFKNYQTLMSGIGENVAGQAANAKASALFNAKSRTDDIVKTLDSFPSLSWSKSVVLSLAVPDRISFLP